MKVCCHLSFSFTAGKCVAHFGGPLRRKSFQFHHCLGLRYWGRGKARRVVDSTLENCIVLDRRLARIPLHRESKYLIPTADGLCDQMLYMFSELVEIYIGWRTEIQWSPYVVFGNCKNAFIYRNKWDFPTMNGLQVNRLLDPFRGRFLPP